VILSTVGTKNSRSSSLSPSKENERGSFKTKMRCGTEVGGQFLQLEENLGELRGKKKRREIVLHKDRVYKRKKIVHKVSKKKKHM